MGEQNGRTCKCILQKPSIGLKPFLEAFLLSLFIESHEKNLRPEEVLLTQNQQVNARRNLATNY